MKNIDNSQGKKMSSDAAQKRLVKKQACAWEMSANEALKVNYLTSGRHFEK